MGKQKKPTAASKAAKELSNRWVMRFITAETIESLDRQVDSLSRLGLRLKKTWVNGKGMYCARLDGMIGS